MHNGPSEASILRSLYEKEAREHALVKEILKQIRERAQDLLDNSGADSGDYIEFVQSLVESSV